MAEIPGLLGYWLGRKQRAQESSLRELSIQKLKREQAEAERLTQLGEAYPTGFEPTPSEAEVTLTPQEEALQMEQYTPPPEAPVETKMGYPGLTIRDIGALHKIGLTALPPTKEKPRGEMLPTGLVKAREEPPVHYESVKDEFGTQIGTQVFRGGQLIRQLDIAGKEVPLGQPMVAKPTEIQRMPQTEEESKRLAGTPPIGLVEETLSVHDPKGRRLGFQTKFVADPTMTAEIKEFRSWLQGQKIDPDKLAGTPEFTKKYQEFKTIGQKAPEALLTFEGITGLKPEQRGTPAYEAKYHKYLENQKEDRSMLPPETLDKLIYTAMINKRMNIVFDKIQKDPSIRAKFGPLSGRWEKIKVQFAKDPQSTALQQNIRALILEAYGFSGKQISAKEMELFRDALLPRLEQPYENFEASLHIAMDMMTDVYNTTLDIYGKAGWKTKSLQPLLPPKPQPVLEKPRAGEKKPNIKTFWK